MFAVEQQQVPEGDGREGGLLQQEGQLLETLRRRCVHVQQGLVVESHWVQFLPKHTNLTCWHLCLFCFFKSEILL